MYKTAQATKIKANGAPYLMISVMLAPQAMTTSAGTSAVAIFNAKKIETLAAEKREDSIIAMVLAVLMAHDTADSGTDGSFLCV